MALVLSVHATDILEAQGSGLNVPVVVFVSCIVGRGTEKRLKLLNPQPRPARSESWRSTFEGNNSRRLDSYSHSSSYRIMSLLRAPRVLQLSRTWARPQQTPRLLSTTSRRPLGEPNPRDVPDVNAMQMTEDQASMVVAEHKAEESVEQYHPRHQPDYNATVDHGTSTYSPVPKRVMNGSEPGVVTPAAMLSGAPIDLQARTVR
jgi:hypothetical protein